MKLWVVNVLVDGLVNAREGEWLFTNEEAAKRFAASAERLVVNAEVCILTTDVYETSNAARMQAWPFEELRPTNA